MIIFKTVYKYFIYKYFVLCMFSFYMNKFSDYSWKNKYFLNFNKNSCWTAYIGQAMRSPCIKLNSPNISCA